MATKLKIVKTKTFKANDTEHTHYSVAYKGRLFAVNTLRWADDMDSIKVEGDVMTIEGGIDVLQRNDIDQITGETKVYYDLMPKIDLAIAAL